MGKVFLNILITYLANWREINIINEELELANDLKFLKMPIPTFISVYYNNE